MHAQYFINIAETQIYFDSARRRCAAPGARADDKEQTVHFVMRHDGVLLTAARWDDALFGYTVDQRRCGQLWTRDPADDTRPRLVEV